MPRGTRVEKVYKAIVKEGTSKESAAKIAQAQTGQALSTGKPPTSAGKPIKHRSVGHNKAGK